MKRLHYWTNTEYSLVNCLFWNLQIHLALITLGTARVLRAHMCWLRAECDMQKELDKRDLSVLSVLQNEARISNVQLAERVGLSPAACWERVKKLEARGYIRRYLGEIALEKLPGTINFMVLVTLKTHRADDFMKFETDIQKSAHVVRCVAVGGGFDYILEVVVAGMEAYKDFLSGFLERNGHIEKYSAHVVTKNVKSQSVDLNVLFADQI
nr:Lrp/AsnC family transcriptional regulator [uncultured Shimia sp.]